MQVCSKQFMVLLAVLMVGAGVLVGAPFTTGWGKKLAVSTAPKTESDLSLASLSVYNGHASVPIHVLVNCDTNFLTNAVVTGASVIVPPGSSYTFDTKGKDMIKSLSYVGDAANTNVFAAGF